MDIKDIVMSVVVFFLLVYLIFGTFEIVETYNRIQTEMEQRVGDDVVINSDTLTIVDFNVWTDSYRLSNGYKIHSKVIDER